MKKRILTALCCICLLSAGRAHAQWVVTDPGNLAQGIINAAKNIVHTSSTASNMVKNFQETVKIYQQGKEYYDGLRKVKNLVRDARKVQQRKPDRECSMSGQAISQLVTKLRLNGVMKVIDMRIKTELFE